MEHSIVKLRSLLEAESQIRKTERVWNSHPTALNLYNYIKTTLRYKPNETFELTRHANLPNDIEGAEYYYLWINPRRNPMGISWHISVDSRTPTGPNRRLSMFAMSGSGPDIDFELQQVIRIFLHDHNFRVPR